MGILKYAVAGLLILWLVDVYARSPVSNPNHYFVFVADVATIMPEPRTDPNAPIRAKLVLGNVHKKVEWFSDRPDHDSGTINSNRFFKLVWPSLFDEIEPNAVINATPVSGGVDETHSTFLTLGSELSFKRTGAGSLEVEFPDIDIRSWTFIDDPEIKTTLKQVKITVLHNTDPLAPSRWAFTHTGSTAQFQATGGDNYTLIIENVLEDMHDVSHAPSRQWRDEKIAAFVANWDGRFAGEPPNASLTTYLPHPRHGAKKPEVRILELVETPAIVEQRNGQVDLVYKTTLLHGKIDPSETLHAPALFIDSAAKRVFNFKNYCEFPVWVGFGGSEAGNESCTTNLDCPPGKSCNADTGKCECQKDSDCAGGQTCDTALKQCVCSTSDDCPGDNQFCNTDDTPKRCFWALNATDRSDWELDLSLIHI